MQLITKAAIGFVALFLVGVVLAAIPNHRPPVMAGTSAQSYAIAQQEQRQGQAMDHSKMPGMSMDMGDEKATEAAATHDMAHMLHGDNPHMHMTSPRPQTAADVQRADEIVKDLRAGIEKYKDYHVALDEGYCRSRNITSRMMGMDFWKRSRLIRRDPLPCFIRRRPMATNWWARCTRCRSARAKTS